MLRSSRFRRLAGVLSRPRTWVIPYVVLWVLVGLLPITQTDLDIFFWPAATVAVQGQPLMVYSKGGQSVYPDANGPTSLLPLTAVGLVADRLGWDSIDRRRPLALGAFSLFLLLMAREGVAAIERLRRRRLATIPRLLAYGALTLAPPIWQAVAGYGHIEQPIEIWLLLVAARWLAQGWALRAGLALGLSVLSRSAIGLMAIPLAFAALRKGPGTFARLFGATAATGLAGLLPFYLADSPDLVHSLFTYRGGLPVGAGSIWSVASDPSVLRFIQHWDILFVVAAALTANVWFATRPGGFTEERMLGGMTLTSAAFVLFAKTVWPYYFFELFVLATIWTFGRWRRADGPVRLALAPIAITILGMIAELGPIPGQGTRLVAAEGGGMFVMVGLTAIWLAWMARRSPDAPGSRGNEQPAEAAGPAAAAP
ncbi:MAG: hypothetical protein ACHQ0J_07480 [Candidatus Dormibacterales bacterium]